MSCDFVLRHEFTIFGRGIELLKKVCIIIIVIPFYYIFNLSVLACVPFHRTFYLTVWASAPFHRTFNVTVWPSAPFHRTFNLNVSGQRSTSTHL